MPAHTRRPEKREFRAPAVAAAPAHAVANFWGWYRHDAPTARMRETRCRRTAPHGFIAILFRQHRRQACATRCASPRWPSRSATGFDRCGGGGQRLTCAGQNCWPARWCTYYCSALQAPGGVARPWPFTSVIGVSRRRGGSRHRRKAHARAGAAPRGSCADDRRLQVSRPPVVNKGAIAQICCRRCRWRGR